ncbi:MAG: hypothetical protein ACRD2C_13850 [Acidimicrobiales bacterium]
MSRSLLEVLRNVTLDPGEHAAFSADPAGYLAQYGYEDVPSEDLAEAFSLVADTLPADVAQAVSSDFGAEAGEVDAGVFGAEGTQLASEGFAAGPSLDPDPTETTFGAVNGDFDEGAGTDLADDLDGGIGEATDAVDHLDGGIGEAAGTGAADDQLGEPGEAGVGDGFGFGEGSEALTGDYAGTADGLGESIDGLGADAGLGFDDADEAGDLGLGPAEGGVDDDASDFGTGTSDATDADDDFDLDDGLDFGSSDEIDIDDIGAF